MTVLRMALIVWSTGRVGAGLTNPIQVNQAKPTENILFLIVNTINGYAYYLPPKGFFAKIL